MRNAIATLVLIGLLGCATTTEAPDPAAVDAAREKAQVAAGRLMKTLGGELMAALEQGDPESALNVCADVARRITLQTAEAEGFGVGRTALRLRNPSNAPDAFERAVMEGWLAAGGVPHAVEEVVPTADGYELRWMKPIVLNAMCLACHGDADDLSDGVRSALAQRYPEDEATGFASGDLRGAVTVRVPLR